MLRSLIVRYTIRPAEPTDGAWLYRLHAESMRDLVEVVFGCWDDDQQQRFHDAWFNPHLVQIIEYEGHPVGVLDLRFERDVLYLARIEIARASRNKGLGSAVLSDVMKLAREHRKPVVLDVFEANRAKGFYERLGFATVASDGRKARLRWEHER